MAGRGRGRGRGRGASAEPAAAPPAPTQPVSSGQPVGVGSAPQPMRGRGRGRGAAPVVAPQLPQELAEHGTDVAAAGRGRGRGAIQPMENGQDSGRARGGAVVGANGVNGGQHHENGANGLADNMAGLNVGGRGDTREPRQRRVNRHDEENLSSGFFNKGEWALNVNSIRGQPVELVGNAITLYPPQNMDTPAARLYHVDFTPQLDGKRLRIAIVKENSDKLGGRNILYDGGSALFTGSLISEPNGKVEFDFVTKRNESIHVTCSHRSDVFAGSSEHLRIAGVLMKKGLTTLNYVPFGRHHFDPESKIDMRNGYELWPGYATAVNKYEGGLLLVADTTFKLAAVRTVYHELMDIYRQAQSNTQAFQQQAINKIVGRIVFTPYNQKRHRVDDISFEATPMDKFEKRGEQITFKEYYQSVYNIDIKDPKQPLLLSQPKEKDRRRGMTQPILLVPELCHVTGISDEQKADFRFTKAMGEITRQGPPVKARNLAELVNRFSKNEGINSQFNFWNMSFDQSLIQFHGKRLNSPKIAFDKPVDYNTNSADFGTVLKNCRFRSPVTVNNYAIFYVKQNENIAKTLHEKLNQASSGFGMQLGGFRAILVNSPRSEDWIQSIKQTRAEAGNSLSLCIFVLPDNRADRYNAIKRICYVEQPCPSQCVLTKTLSKPQGLMSVVSKLAMQINAKLGGDPWITDFALPGLMIVGMDVYHAGKNRSKSAVGVVGSVNSSFSRYYSRAYMNNEEDVQVMQPAITALLHKFKESNEGRFPKYIVMFRDGVGEGQLQRVMETEVKSFQSVLAELSCDAKLCYVIVSKRIMQRFFSKVRGGELQNPQPGTVVFDTLTKENRFDFFLAPTSSRQGTVTPTHYNVLYDDSPFRQDNGKLMDLAFSMSHMYFNWTGAIRVPAVCQYAHKLAAMCGDNLSYAAPSPVLADTLFYL